MSVDSEGSAGNPTNFGTAGSVTTGTGPDAVALDAPAHKVFVANSGSTLTVIPTTTCNQSTTSGCGSPTQVASSGHLNAPAALAVSGSTLYVGNGNGTVAVYNAGTNAWVTTVNLPSGSVPTALAVDPTNGYVYVADGNNNRIEYFNATTCNTSVTSGCSSTPSAVSVGNDPVALSVATSPGDLYVANAGSQGGISVVSLSTHAVLTTIPTSQPNNGTGVVQSIGLSPDGNEVLAVRRPELPGDVLATINTSTNTITATVGLETGTDSIGQLVSDGPGLRVGHRPTAGGRPQNPESRRLGPGQPALRHRRRRNVARSRDADPPSAAHGAGLNDALYFSEGAGGGGISKTFTIRHSRGARNGQRQQRDPLRQCGRRLPRGPRRVRRRRSEQRVCHLRQRQRPELGRPGGTSGAVPLWAAVLAVVASANSNTAGYGGSTRRSVSWPRRPLAPTSMT